MVCPQNAKSVRSDIEKAGVILSQNKHVYASVAPSFAANFEGCDIEVFGEALKQLGFYAAEETAVGATAVKKQYEEMIASSDNSVIISSCCSSVNLLIRKHYPEALPFLANIITPAQAHAVDIRERTPDAKVIFICPCISKKDECDSMPGYDDCVLTFEEISEMLRAKNIRIPSAKKPVSQDDAGRTRSFPTPGGIIKCMDTDKCDPESRYTYVAVDGIENCMAALEDIRGGKLSGCFIEMSACAGSCIGGPLMDAEHNGRISDFAAIKRYTTKTEFDVAIENKSELKTDYEPISLSAPMPTEAEIAEILLKMGKTDKSEELNCGTCGYNTCREKAIAVFQHKAEVSMCLPYLKEKAESMSDNIIKNTPNAIIVLNELLEVQNINVAARTILFIRSASDILGEHVNRILDPMPFMDVLNTGRDILEREVYLSEYGKYVELSVVYDKSFHQLICIMRDITEEHDEKSKKETQSRQTIEVTDKVIEKQMRVVQEIASLLGETTAEMKVALTKLKESMKDE